MLNEIRDAVVADPDRWRQIKQDPAFADKLGGLAEGDMLKNAPRGYAKDHPFVDDLRRKSLFAFASCTEDQVCQPDFPDRVMDTFGAMTPLMKFTVDALHVGWD